MTRGTLTLLNRETGEISSRRPTGCRSASRSAAATASARASPGKVVQTGQPAVVPRISEEPLFLNRTGARRKLAQEGHLVHLRADQLGSEVDRRARARTGCSPRTVSLEEDVRLLSIIASMIAQAVRLRQRRWRSASGCSTRTPAAGASCRSGSARPTSSATRSAMQEVYDLIAQVCQQRRDRADPRRERHRQGAGRPRDPLQQRRGRTSRSSRSTAPRCPRTCSRASCSATRRGRSPARSPSARAGSSWPTAARSSSTRSATLARHAGQAAARAAGAGVRARRRQPRRIKADVRVIAATNRDLEEMIDRGHVPRRTSTTG